MAARKYYRVNNPRIGGLWECCEADEPANFFDARGRRWPSGTWPSWFNNNPNACEITKQEAAALILAARATQFRTASSQLVGDVVDVDGGDVFAVFEIEGQRVTFSFPADGFTSPVAVGDRLLNISNVIHLESVL
jgi:hypothetical protein